MSPTRLDDPNLYIDKFLNKNIQGPWLHRKLYLQNIAIFQINQRNSLFIFFTMANAEMVLQSMHILLTDLYMYTNVHISKCMHIYYLFFICDYSCIYIYIHLDVNVCVCICQLTNFNAQHDLQNHQSKCWGRAPACAPFVVNGATF